MTGPRLFWRVLGGMLTLLSVVVGSLLLWSQITRPVPLSWYDAQTYPFAADTLEVEVPVAEEIQLLPGADQKVTVEQRVEWTRGERPTVRYEWERQRLRLSPVDCQTLDGCVIRLTIRVPAGLQRLTVNAKTSQVMVQDLSGDLNLTGNWVDARGLSGDLEIRSNGSVSASQLTSARVRVTSGSSVELRYDRAPYEVRVEAPGWVELAVPPGDRYRVDAGAASQEIRVQRSSASNRWIRVLGADTVQIRYSPTPPVTTADPPGERTAPGTTGR